MSQGFEEFVVRRGPALQRLARGLVRDPADAADVVEEVLARALLGWRRIGNGADPVVQVDRMLVRESAARRRRRVRGRRPPAAATVPPGAGNGPDDRDALLAAVRALPPAQRAAVALRHLDGLSDERIAAVLGTTPAAVRADADRGLAALRARVPSPS